MGAAGALRQARLGTGFTLGVCWGPGREHEGVDEFLSDSRLERVRMWSGEPGRGPGTS